MSRPAISNTKLNEHLTLSECHPDSECRVNNWWLYDKRAYGSGMNVALRAKTRDEAFVGAIEFWAERATKFEQAYLRLKAQVDAFVGQFVEPEDNADW
jgi:hypothetical protein